MIKYFDYYNLDYNSLKRNAEKQKFVNDLVRDEYFIGLERARKKTYDNIEAFQPLPNDFDKGTKEWVLQEIKNSKRSIMHFSQYCRILDPTESFIDYNPYLYQQSYYNVLKDSKYVISDKCRQVGFSVGTQVYLLHELMFKKNQRIEIISINDNISKEFLKKLKGTYDNLVDWWKEIPMFQKKPKDEGGNNEHEMTLNNGSNIKSLPRTKQGSRSGSLSILVFDEAAFIEYMKDQWKGSYYSIAKSEKSKAIVISTRNGNMGIGEWYYNMLTSTENGETDFNLVEVNWWEVPDYLINPKWLDATYKNTSRDSFLQEVCKKWLVAGETVLDKEKLLNYRIMEHISTSIVNQETQRTEAIDGLRIFRKPVIEDDDGHPRRYAITADVGTGGSKSFSAFHVFDLYDHTQVAEFKKRITTNEYSKLLIRVAKYYNEAVIAWERNNPGEAITSDLVKIYKYIKCYRRSRRKPQYRDWGWVTSNKTRPLMVNDLIEDFTNDNIKICSKRTIDEGLSFIWNEKNGKPEAAAGAVDDLIMSLSIYCHLKNHLDKVSIPKAAMFKDDQGFRKKVWNIVYDDQVEAYYRENYWLYGESTRKKINDRYGIEEVEPEKKRGRPKKEAEV